MSVALVTGAGGILGSRMVKALAREGHAVALVDRDGEAIDALARTLTESGNRVLAVACDITRIEDLRAARATIEGGLGEVSVLVNNAATKSQNFFEPFATFPRSDWDEVMEVNLTGAMQCCQVFGSVMAESGAGSIVNILSVYGVVAPDQRIYEGSEYEGRAINTPAVYSASKAALWGLTQYLASYWGSLGVRVNAVTPGGIFSGQNSTFQQRYAARVPMSRMGETHEIADAVVFLAGSSSSYVNGHNLIVDGGLTVW